MENHPIMLLSCLRSYSCMRVSCLAQDKFNSNLLATEMYYNILDALKRFSSLSDCKIFTAIFEEKLPFELKDELENMLELLHNEAIKEAKISAGQVDVSSPPTRANSYGAQGSANVISLDIFIRLLRRLFPFKPDQSFGKLSKVRLNPFRSLSCLPVMHTNECFHPVLLSCERDCRRSSWTPRPWLAEGRAALQGVQCSTSMPCSMKTTRDTDRTFSNSSVCSSWPRRCNLRSTSWTASTRWPRATIRRSPSANAERPSLAPIPTNRGRKSTSGYRGAAWLRSRKCCFSRQDAEPCVWLTLSAICVPCC